MNKWVKRICRKQAVPLAKIWGNHDGILLYLSGEWFVGEALGRGSYPTPLWKYEREMERKGTEIRLFHVIGASEVNGLEASRLWMNWINGTPYPMIRYHI